MGNRHNTMNSTKTSFLSFLSARPPLQAGIVTVLVAGLLVAGAARSARAEQEQAGRDAHARLQSIVPLTTAADTALRQLRDQRMTEARIAAQRQNTRGTLTIISEPEGAYVYINGIQFGEAPLSLSEVRIGRYGLRITAGGYAEQSATVDVPGDVPVATTVRLTRQTGRLKLETTPAGLPLRIEQSSSVVLNESFQTIAAVSPCETALPTGFYTVFVQRDGYREFERTVEIRPNETEQCSVTMTPARLVITSTPTGADVYHHGEKVGTTPYTIEAKESISGSFEIRMEGYETDEFYAFTEVGNADTHEAKLVVREPAAPQP